MISILSPWRATADARSRAGDLARPTKPNPSNSFTRHCVLLTVVACPLAVATAVPPDSLTAIA